MDVGDRRWHAAVLAGDDCAWRDGYDAAFESVHGYVYWRCAGMAELVDDVVQETWLTAVRRIGSYRPERSSFANWVRGVAANVLRNKLRERRRRLSRTASLVGEPAARLEDRNDIERSVRIAQTLARLPDQYESVLREKYCDGLNVIAIAAGRDVSPKAIESLLTRARAAFRAAFEHEEMDDG